MKKKYVDPEVEIVEIDEADIIFASGSACTCDENNCGPTNCSEDFE